MVNKTIWHPLEGPSGQIWISYLPNLGFPEITKGPHGTLCLATGVRTRIDVSSEFDQNHQKWLGTTPGAHFRKN